MREKGSMEEVERTILQPVIVPKGSGSTIVHLDIGWGPVCRELIIDNFLDKAVTTVAV